MEGSEAEILVKQYKLVFTVPKVDKMVNNPEIFFSNCNLCEAEKDHICEADSYMSNELNYCQGTHNFWEYNLPQPELLLIEENFIEEVSVYQELHSETDAPKFVSCKVNMILDDI